MCGIAGLYHSNLSEGDRKKIVTDMGAALKKRGPDGDGYFLSQNVALAHRRLAIIAPSPEGLQPLTRNNLVITYNGELYNYLEQKERLEKKGFVFRTKTDTEVILALFEEQGLDFVKNLNGIFAFAIYDKTTGRLICVRDQFGIKPFLYSKTEQGLVFASELKSILASSLVERKINYQGLQSLMEKGSVSQPLSMVEGVHHLMPGHLMILEKDQIKVHRYFDLAEYNENKISDEVALTQDFEEALTKSIHEQMVSDVPLGAFLSGGIDSSLIVALMKRKKSDIQTFSVGFESRHFTDQFSETSLAKYVADHLQTEHHEIIISDSEIKNQLRSIVFDLDHPSIDGLNSYFVSKFASQKLKVSLSGTGADEILSGYIWFKQMLDFSKATKVSKIIHSLKGKNFISYYNSLHRVFNDAEISGLLKAPPNKSYNIEDPLFEKDPLSRTSGLVVTGYLQNQLLADIDTASMAHGLEVRVPYLNPILVQKALALPTKLKMGNPDSPRYEDSYEESGVKKVLLNIGKKYLPSDFSTRKKRGFSLPMKSWLSSTWATELLENLSAETVTKRGVFNPQATRKLYEGFLNNTVPWTQVWLLLSVELWCQEVLDAK